MLLAHGQGALAHGSRPWCAGVSEDLGGMRPHRWGASRRTPLAGNRSQCGRRLSR